MHDRTYGNGMEKFQTGLFLRVYLKPDKQLMGHILWGGGGALSFLLFVYL